MKVWETLSREVLLDFGQYLTVERHEVELPNGEVIEDWPWLDMPEYVIILAVTKEKATLFFRQFKYAVGEPTLALPGGYIEPEEGTLKAAQRELLEETGYEAPQWIDLGHYHVDGNRGAGRAHLLLALDAERIQEPDSDDLEEQELVYLTREEMEEALSTGRIKVLSWVACIALGLRYLDRMEASASA